MDRKIPKIMTRRYANAHFKTIGLCLILYALLALFIPTLLKRLIVIKNSPILEQEYVYIGLFLMFIVIGTIIPFSILAFLYGIKVKDYFKKATCSFKELMVNCVVYFTLISVAIFVAYAIANKFQINVSIVGSIGSILEDNYLTNPLYVVMFLFFFPILEEIAFRGILQKSLYRYGKKFAIIVTTIIYAVAHGSLVEIFPAIVTGYFLGKMALRYQSIQPCIFAHIFYKAIIFLLYITNDSYKLYVFIGLCIIYVLAIVFALNHTYQPVLIKKSHNNNNLAQSIFLTNTTVMVSICLFILHSILLFFI